MSETAEPMPVQPMELGYESPQNRARSRLIASSVILFAGLGTAVIGGCFLIGVMMTSSNGFTTASTPPTLTSAQIMLLIVLYVMAAAAFGTSVWLFILGLRGLIGAIK